MATTSYQERQAERRTARVPFRQRMLRAVITPKTRGFLRAATYIGVVCAVGAGLSARSAWGQVSEQALVTGRELSKLEDLSGPPEHLMLNGQKLNISSALSDLSMTQVLDRFQGVCNTDGTLQRDFREIKGLLDDKALLEAAKHGHFGVIRQENKDDGVIACAVKNPRNGKQSTWQGIAKFAKSGDLADIGLLRYAYVRRTESGRTHVLAVWTDGSFKLSALVPPKNGDSPGSDIEGVPRPEQSVRYLTAAAEGRPHSVRIYESKAVAGDVLNSYDAQMPKRGWEPIDIGDQAPTARYFSKDGVDLLVVVEQSEGRSVISMVQTR
jgi:hypothetical protein